MSLHDSQEDFWSARYRGLLFLHGYTPKQIEYGTGGPSAVENLYTAALLEGVFSDWEIVLLREHEELIEVDDRREDGDSEHQYQPFEVAPGEEAREVQNQNKNGDDIKQRKQHLSPLGKSLISCNRWRL
jgi:hypothetical protein